MRAAYIPLPAIINSGVLDCLPLHVRDGIGLAVAERVNVILHPLRTGTPRKPADCEALSREGWDSIDLTLVTVLHDDVIELRLAGNLIYTAPLMLPRSSRSVLSCPMTIRVATWCDWPVRAADGETIMDPTTLQPVKDAFALFREGLAAVRDAKALLPAAQQEAVTITLEKAGTAASLAEAQIAKALGFRLHECTWPPQIMLAVKTPNGEEKRCPACGATTDIRTPRRVVRSSGAISTEQGDRSPENKPRR